jgi:hypothetical protein
MARLRSMRPHLLGAALMLLASASLADDASHYDDRSEYVAPKALHPLLIDGIADDAAWRNAQWQTLEHRWLGPEFSDEDFQGRFKVVWTENKIYILGEIVDDILFDSHRDPLTQYWDDDCLEIFLDENYSGGDHQFNHSAFAYHVALDNQTTDIGSDQKPRDFSHHVDSRWRQHGGVIVWELAIDVYADDYDESIDDNQPVALSANKKMGLMIAYNDNDGSELRENFVGSESVISGPKDRGWIDAGLFGALILAE